MMYDVLKLAALSAALAAALVTLTDGRNAAPSAARFLSDRLETQVSPVRSSGARQSLLPASSCGRGWPYHDTCDAAAQPLRPVRMVSPDNMAAGGIAATRTLIAQQ